MPPLGVEFRRRNAHPQARVPFAAFNKHAAARLRESHPLYAHAVEEVDLERNRCSSALRGNGGHINNLNWDALKDDRDFGGRVTLPHPNDELDTAPGGAHLTDINLASRSA